MDIILSERQQIVYDALCEQFGEDATNFFTNVLGMQICESEDIYDELVQMGAIADTDECADMDDEDDEEAHTLTLDDVLETWRWLD